jgi:hypothetical protein
MKAYIYKPEQCGLSDWPSGVLRLNVEPVAAASSADVFIYPGALHSVTRPLNTLPYFAGNESRHVFFHCSDDEKLYGESCAFIRCNTRRWYYAKDRNTISWPWPVDDFQGCVDVDKFTYDLSFHGWVSSDARRLSVASCLQDMRCDIATYRDFYGYIKDPIELARRRTEFMRSMCESKIALCPESIPGVFPYRFFEAMSAGRVPCLVGSNYVLPFEDEIPYKDFCIFVPLDRAHQASEPIVRFLESHTDDEIKECGRKARHFWERFLQRDRWVQLMTYAVEKKMKQLHIWSGELAVV